MKSRIHVALAFVAVLLLLLPFSPAAGSDMTDKPIRVRLDPKVYEQEYLPIPAQNPVTPNVQDQPTEPNPENCKTLPSCDTIPMIIDIPADASYKLIITLSFEHLEGGNDLDAYFFNDVLEPDPTGQKSDTCTPAPGEETRCKRFRMGNAATGGEPEVAKFADLYPTSPDNVYWIVINCFSGATSYKIKAEVSQPKLGVFDFDDPQRSPRALVSPSKSSPSKPVSGGSTLPQVPEPVVDTGPKVKVPGPDGELTEMPLTAIKGQATPEKAPDRTPLIVITIAVVVMGLATFVFFKIRGRQNATEST